MSAPPIAQTAPDVHADDRIKEAAAEMALEGYSGPGAPSQKSDPEFAAIRKAGSDLWLDTGDREAIAALWCREITAVTTNNTLVNQVAQHGAFDAFIPKAAERLRSIRSLSPNDLILELGFLVNARIALSLVQEFGAQVSVELHPAVADDVEASLVFARRYYALCPERFIVKIPLQPAGFLVVRRLHEEGIPVNYTLGFSARQNYLAALFSRPRYVNVFLGRLNSVVEENGLGSPENIGEKATLASQEGVREVKQVDPSIPTLQIAASVRSGQQIADLAGVDVLTVPPKAAQEYRDKGMGSAVRVQKSGDLSVTLNDAHRSEVEVLWAIDEGFRRFASDLAMEETGGWSGKEFAAYAKDCTVDLFHDWTAEEIATLRIDGKIPKLAKWPNVPFDDLMTQSALQSFAVDQQALDDRLSRLVSP